MIILSGASGGIGKEIINQLSGLDRVIGLYNNSIPGKINNKEIIYEKVNIEEENEVRGFVDKYRQSLSRITLIHLAAAKIDGLSIDYPLSNWDKVMNVNLRGNFILTRQLLKFMVNDNWGRVIHVSSQGAVEGDIGTVAYSSSKSALLGMSKVMAKEYARFNITSNVLMLGAFEAGLYLQLPEEQKKAILGRIPSKKLGNLSNISEAINFLMRSQFVNGSVINIDGGA